MSWLTYVWYKLFAVLVRAVMRYLSRARITAPADDVYRIPSRDAGRTIKAHVYRPLSVAKRSPVLINFHGSGFLLPLHGSDGPFCRQISRETEYTVLDVQYRLAPEHPFPAALNDVEDVVNWVLRQPTDFDLTKVAISGFSAGGNLALAASSTLFPRDTFRAVLTFYPVLDLYTKSSSKVSPDPNGKPIPPAIAGMFNRCYIPSKLDARDPRISPAYGSPDRFPDRILIVTAAGDNLAGEGEALAARIDKLPGRQVVCQRMQGCNHGWDKKAPEGTMAGDAKDKAYAMAVAMLWRIVDDAQYRKDVLYQPSEEAELSRNQALLEEAHHLGLKVPEIEVAASLTASIASGMVDLSSSSPALSQSGSSTDRNSVCEGLHPPQPPSSSVLQPPPPKSHDLDQVASSLSDLTVGSGPVKSGSVRSIASLSTRPTSYCSSEGRLPYGNTSDGGAAKSPMRNHRHSMMSAMSGDKKEKRRTSFKSAIGKIPFRRKRAPSSVLLPPEAQITVAKGERGEDKVFVESRTNESQQLPPTSAPNDTQPTSTPNPNEESGSVMKLEIPVFDNESLQRSLVNPELVRMREAHRLERNRHVAFQDAVMNQLRCRQQAAVASQLSDNKRTEDEKREKNAANAVQVEERQLAVEMEQEREFERAKQNARTRIKHMEGYFSSRRSSTGSGSDSQPRRYTSQQKAQLQQEHHHYDSMDQLHEAKINVLRERQERRLMEVIERMDNELDAMIDKHAEGFAELQKQHQQEESATLQALDSRKTKLRHRWNLEEAILRRKLELANDRLYGPLPPLAFSDSHYETRDSAICVIGSGDEEQKGDALSLI